jgi:hypothetical protein
LESSRLRIRLFFGFYAGFGGSDKHLPGRIGYATQFQIQLMQTLRGGEIRGYFLRQGGVILLPSVSQIFHQS